MLRATTTTATARHAPYHQQQHSLHHDSRHSGLSKADHEGISRIPLMCPIKTPYKEDGRFDLDAYDALIETQISNGVEGFIIGGTTGEGHLMSWDEHVMLIAHTSSFFGDRVKVIGNTGSNNTNEVCRATCQGFAVGMHGSLQINPYYGKACDKGIVQHFEVGLSYGPGIIYNVPSRTSQDVPVSLIEKISQHPNFLGVKECMGNDRIAEYSKLGIRTWSGNDDQAHDGRHLHGSQGVISVTANVVPGLISKLMTQPDDDLNKKLLPLFDWLFAEPNPIALNTMLAMMGACKPVFRLPYVPLGLEQRQEGIRIMESIGLEHFPAIKNLQVLNDDDFVSLSRH